MVKQTFLFLLQFQTIATATALVPPPKAGTKVTLPTSIFVPLLAAARSQNGSGVINTIHYRSAASLPCRKPCRAEQIPVQNKRGSMPLLFSLSYFKSDFAFFHSREYTKPKKTSENSTEYANKPQLWFNTGDKKNSPSMDKSRVNK